MYGTVRLVFKDAKEKVFQSRVVASNLVSNQGEQNIYQVQQNSTISNNDKRFSVSKGLVMPWEQTHQGHYNFCLSPSSVMCKDWTNGNLSLSSVGTLVKSKSVL